MSILTGSITLPGIGDVPRVAVIGIGGIGAAYVVYRYVSGGSTGYAGEDTTDTADAEYDDTGTIPEVAGFSSGIGYSGYGDQSTDTDDDTVTENRFTGTTNQEWSQYAAEKLQTDGTWSYSVTAAALGAYLERRALTSTEQQIVRAAIGVAGYPPVGTYTVIGGGNVDITVAPTGLKVDPGTTTVKLSWSPVAGATGYLVYRSGTAGNVGQSTGTTRTITGLTSSTGYTFTVAATGMNGKPGPKSSSVATRTKGVTLRAPTGLKATGITTTTVTLSWSAVPGAEYYRVYVNDKASGSADGTSYRITGLKPATRYRLTVKADTTRQTPGPSSAAKTVTTKRK
jgi:hypothetical protein